MSEAAAHIADNTGNTDNVWMSFWLKDQLYAIPIDIAEQIVNMQPVTPVPEYPEYAKGIINLRGNIIPLVDLNMRFGNEETVETDHTCIIITSLEENKIGFMVDNMDAVGYIPPEMVSELPRVGESVLHGYVSGVARVPAGNGEKAVLCVDVKTVLDRMSEMF